MHTPLNMHIFLCTNTSNHTTEQLNNIHLLVGMKSGHKVGFSVSLFSPCPYQCMISKFVVRINFYCDEVVFENQML